MALSDTLCVERTYLASDWLHTTIDAHGEQTRFWYDGQGNPLIIRDRFKTMIFVPLPMLGI